MFKLKIGLSAAFAAGLLMTWPAHAEPVIVKVDQAKMINIAGQAGTVVVGNPNIADVSVRGSQVFVHGRTQGATNLIILDRDGNQLAMVEVNVDTQGGQPVAVFRGGPRNSYNCAPICESTLQIGDQNDAYFKILAEQNGAKGILATGAATQESASK
jgi:Flp pilus assembly secretin CpaC